MLSALITSQRGYPTMLLAEQLVHQWLVHPGPLVLGTNLFNFPTPTEDRGPNCLTTFWTQLAYRFKWRTAIPLGPTTAPGCDEPTSRCQTSPSMWALGEISLLSPAYLLSFERWPFHAEPPDHYDRLSSLFDL